MSNDFEAAFHHKDAADTASRVLLVAADMVTTTRLSLFGIPDVDKLDEEAINAAIGTLEAVGLMLARASMGVDELERLAGRGPWFGDQASRAGKDHADLRAGNRS